jgi:hypothetical protein
MDRPVTYFFARLILVGRYTETLASKRDLIGQALSADSVVEHHSYLWKFLEVAQFRDDDGGGYFTGFLAKFRSEDVERVEGAHVGVAPVEDKIAAKARFILHVRSGIIAYHPVRQGISMTSFERRFAELFQRGLGNLFIDVGVVRLIDETTIWAAIEKFTRIDRFDVTIHPTNPDYREVYRDIDEHLKALRAAKMTQTIVARDAGEKAGAGLDVAGDRDSRAKITMAADGYGEASVTGVMDGRKRTVSTRQTPVAVQGPSDVAPPGDALDAVAPTIARLEKHEK